MCTYYKLALVSMLKYFCARIKLLCLSSYHQLFRHTIEISFYLLKYSLGRSNVFYANKIIIALLNYKIVHALQWIEQCHPNLVAYQFYPSVMTRIKIRKYNSNWKILLLWRMTIRSRISWNITMVTIRYTQKS